MSGQVPTQYLLDQLAGDLAQASGHLMRNELRVVKQHTPRSVRTYRIETTDGRMIFGEEFVSANRMRDRLEAAIAAIAYAKEIERRG